MASLEAYSNYKDGVNTFRLCHRFGHGPDVHVSKLPREHELAIEQFVITEARNVTSDRWLSGFRCVEARCAPVDHYGLVIEDMTYGELVADMLHDCGPCCVCERIEQSEESEESEQLRHCGLDCRECTKVVEESINERLVSNEAIVDFHMVNLHNWERLFARDVPGTQGQGARLRKVSQWHSLHHTKD